MQDEKIIELLKVEKTPLYVFDIGELEDRIRYLKEALPDRIELCYAVKANTFIAKEADRFVDHLEICSPGEYRICKSLSIPDHKYIISGVNKEPALMEEMIISGIRRFTAESTNQFELLKSLAIKTGRKISILLRLTAGSQFGMDEEDLERIVKDNLEEPSVVLSGIQYFSGTQKTSLKKLRRELNYLDKYIQELRERTGYYPDKLEYGPGFPVCYFRGEEFEETEFLGSFNELLSEMDYQGSVTLELGRSIAASCGTYLTQVVDIKENKTESYAILDGGMHQLVYFGQSMAMKHPHIKLFPKREEKEVKEWNLCGSLCTTNDILVKRYPLANLKVGDVLSFEITGAYSMTEGIALFLSRELPGIFLLDREGNFLKVRDIQSTDILNTPRYE